MYDVVQIRPLKLALSTVPYWVDCSTLAFSYSGWGISSCRHFFFQGHGQYLGILSWRVIRVMIQPLYTGISADLTSKSTLLYQKP